MAKQDRVGITIRRTAGEVKRYRIWKKIVPAGILLAALILIIGYVVSVLYMKFGSFTVSVNKLDGLKYALTLSESPDFKTYTSRLNADISEEVTNIDGKTLPDWLANVDGEHNGDNYVAYTFYCKNMGQKTVTYSYEMYIANMTYEVEKAVRVRLYVDEFIHDGKNDIHFADYAYARTDGVEGPEPGTIAFQSGNTIVKDYIEHFMPGDITQYTVVIWLEGPDPDCVDKIIGGEFKVDMLMEVVRDEEEGTDVKSPGIRSAALQPFLLKKVWEPA